MSPAYWRRATRADLSALAAFLREGEERRVGFSGRLLRRTQAGDAETGLRFRLPSPLRGAVWLADRDGSEPQGLAGAVLCHPSGLVYPIFPDGRGGDAFLALLASSFAPASAIGMAEDVSRYESALCLKPRASVAYRLMGRRASHVSTNLHIAQPASTPGLSVRRAAVSDLEALLPLQEAYEIEEVLTPIHSFNAAACRASLERSLQRNLVFLAEERPAAGACPVVVGKAGTNARGFEVDQVGGVFTVPERRGRGVALSLMLALLSAIESEGRRASLFVKPSNAAARRLYGNLGFEELGDYHADYF
jgi:Predicted acetyltransferase